MNARMAGFNDLMMGMQKVAFPEPIKKETPGTAGGGMTVLKN